MVSTVLPVHFAKIGARLTTSHAPRLRKPFDLNIARDVRGEHFTLAVKDATQAFHVLQANRAARHLLLHAAGKDGGERFLCGHDERHWFTAAVAERVTTIMAARRSLLPRELRGAGLNLDQLVRRHNDVYKRQGEWFFVATDKDLSAYPIHLSEPLQRGTGRGKPHLVAELIRFGGDDVVLAGATEYRAAEWDRLVQATPSLGHQRHRRATKNAEVYVRGAVRHADHATLVLPTWHRVYLNGEVLSGNMSFYD